MNAKQDRTLLGMPVPTRAAMAALALLGLARCLFLLFPDFETVEIDNVRLHRFYEKELNYRAMGSPTPKVVIFGTSRLIGLRHLPLMQGLEFAQKDILLLSLPGNDFWYTHAFLRRNPNVLKECELLIVDLLPMQIYGATMRREDDSTFLRHATLSEKLNTRTPFHRIRAVTNTALPLWSERMRIDNWRRVFTHRKFNDEEKLDHLRRRPVTDYAQIQRMTKIHRELGEEGRIALVLSTLFPQSKIVPTARTALDQICADLPRQCTLAMIWIPLRPDVQAILETNEIWKDSHDSYLRLIAGFNHPKVVKQFFKTPADLDLSADDYSSDGVHFTEDGNAKLSLSVGRIGRQILASKPVR